MSYLLFEDPKYLMLFLGFVDFLLLFSLKKIPFEKKKITIIILTLLIPILHFTAKFVETDNEKIDKILLTVSKNSPNLQIEAIREFLSDDFNGKFENEEFNKDKFIKLLKKKLGRRIINEIKLIKKEIEFDKNNAKSIIISNVYVTSSSKNFMFSLEWQVLWHKKDKKWLVISTKPPRLIRYQ